MKKTLLLSLISGIFILFSLSTIAQSKEQTAKSIQAESNKQAKTLIRTENDLKSGNWQDILASFFQLGLSDLATNNGALEFKANLFALKAKADSTLLIDTNYVKHNFSRNFQFNFSLKLDTQYHFNGLKAGFTYALINKRDSSVLNLLKTPADGYFIAFMDSLQFVVNRFDISLRKEGQIFKSEKDSLLAQKVKQILDTQLETGTFNSKAFPKEFLAFANFEIIDKNFHLFDSLYNDELGRLRQRPFLSISTNASFLDKPGLLSDGKVELVYLQGLTKKGRNLELDVRAGMTMTDTTVNNQKNRIEFSSTGGCNWAIITSRNNINKSLVEFKPHFEYSSILRGVYPGEKKEKFLANAELRIRIMDNLWLPLTLKYDLKDHNFLGFLKVSFNMNAFKKPAS